LSKLALTHRISRDFDQADLQEVIRQIEKQSNDHAEGLIVARHNAMTAAPTTGNWVRGDIVWNSAPSGGGFIGWVCVTSGTPGTWKTWGAITV
jgi:hypothetical protein